MSIQRAEFRIGGMNCKHCVAAVQKAIDTLPGIEALDVIVGRVRVEFDPTQVGTNDLVRVIADAGYDVDLV